MASVGTDPAGSAAGRQHEEVCVCAARAAPLKQRVFVPENAKSAGSSVGQSTGFLIRRSQVRVLPGAFQQVSITKLLAYRVAVT